MEAKTNNAAGQGSSKTIVINRTFRQPLDTVWKAWTEPEYFKQWWGPTGYYCTECKIDLELGGKCLANMIAEKDGQVVWSTGIFKEIAPQKKLVYEDNFSDSQGNVVSPDYYKMPGEWNNVIVTVELKESANGETQMSLRHEGIPSEMYDDCITGWNQSLDKIEKIK